MATSSIAFLLAIFGLMILGQFQRIEIYPWPAFYLHDVLFVFIALWQLFSKQNWFAKLKLIKWRKMGVFWLFVVWVFLGWLSAGVDGELNFQSLLYPLRYLVYGFVLQSLLAQTKSIKPEVQAITIVLGLYLLLWAFGQYLFLPDMRFLSIFGWDDHYYRLVGTQLDPNFMGLILVMLLLRIESSLLFAKKRSLKIILRILVLLGLALTFSRASFLCLAVGLFFMDRFKKMWLLLILAIFIVFVPKPAGEGVVLQRTASIEARVVSSKNDLLRLSGKEWLIGQGLFNSAKLAYQNESYVRSDHARLPDNLLLLILQGSGVVGLGLAIILFCQIMVRYWQKPSIIAVISSVLFHSFFNNSLFQPFVFIYLGLILISEVD